jgi:uncharacterized protein DUF4349
MKTNKFLSTAFVLLFLFFTSCNLREKPSNDNEAPHSEESGKNDKIAPTTMQRTMNIANIQPVLNKEPEINYNTQDKRMIIRTGSMSVEVDKYDETEGRIKDIVSKFSGYITNSASNLNANGKKQGTITIRAASEKYDAMVSELSKIGKVMNQNISGKDVTEEYMDAEARLKTQRELEQRLLKLLSEKTAKLTDVVDVEQKLSQVRENIEKTEGRMKYLKDQASFSTLSVSVYEPSLLVTSTGGGFFYEMEQSFKKGLEGFTKVLSGIITIVIALIPVIVILGIGYTILRKILRKRKLVKA